ncbi:MAG: SH3 domain-containing protein, partial [Clostridia bacterium]|nr:SH3 domain-containing protein [Clostridia bacterium]
NDNGENWTAVVYGGNVAYVMSSFLDVMTQAESDAYESANLATPVPDFEKPGDEITQTPDDSGNAEVTEPPVMTDPPVAPNPPVNTDDAVEATVIERFGKINDTQVKFREGPATSYKSLGALKKGTVVWMVDEIVNDKNVKWTRVLIDGTEAYVMSKFLTVMTQEESDAYADANLATPVPEAGGQTGGGGSVPTEPPVTEPPVTEAPAPEQPEQPEQPEDDGFTNEPAYHIGYVLTARATALRTEVSHEAHTVITTLPQETLLQAMGHTITPEGEVWSLCVSLDNYQGYVLQDDLLPLTDPEAQYYIAKWEASQPTSVPTNAPTPEPPVQQGYAYTVGDGVYFRSMPSTMSDIKNVLARNIVVYVENQQYVDGVAWHIVRFDNEWGYIRADMLRMMTAQEEINYLNSQQTAPPAVQSTPQPFDENALSSYGYVSAKTVNFRKGASTASGKIMTLKQYAFCLILGTEVMDGDVWYRVNYNGTEGYLHSNYFKQMTVAEFEEFYGSEEYLQGVKNNTTSSATAAPSIGGTSGIVSPEDQTVNQWTDPNSGLHVSYAPFDPFATVAPIATPEATIPLEPVATATIAPLPSPQQTNEVIYPQEETESGSALGWIIGVLIAVTLIGGGIYGYVIYARGKKRAAAQRAAARRAAAQQRPVGPDGRPYARPSGPAQQPRTAYPQQGQMPRNAYQQPTQPPRTAYQQPTNPPAAPQQNAQSNAPRQNPYARPVTQQNPADNPYRRPESAQPARQPKPYTASYRPADSEDAPTFTASYRSDNSAPRRRRQQSSRLTDSDDNQS